MYFVRIFGLFSAAAAFAAVFAAAFLLKAYVLYVDFAFFAFLEHAEITPRIFKIWHPMMDPQK